MKTVYIVTALEDSRVVEQFVFSTLRRAKNKFTSLVKAWGGANVCLSSRAVKGE